MEKISKDNSEFWHEMCGSILASSLGIQDFSPNELSKFDREYFHMYPYLKPYFSIKLLVDSSVVEFGLGYGSLSQFLAKNSKTYVGIDIAEGPVDLVNHRIQQIGASSKAKANMGSALNMPFVSESIDLVTSIGCFHHTGNFRQCINETHRVLRPGGKAIIMVYNKYSYRRWYKWPIKTFISLFKNSNIVSEDERAAYDQNISGGAAPETQFYSICEVKKIAKQFKKIKITKENWSSRYPRLRQKTFPTIAKLCGLDLYIELEK
jgi:SAM-dependent methyltransferase